jgi:hypothetical protein
MPSLLTLLLFLLAAISAEAKKRLRRSTSPSPTPSPSPTIAPISHASKCSEEGSFTLINVFLNPPVPRKGDKVTLSVFYYAPVEVEDPDIIFAFQLAGKTFTHKSSLCDNKLSKQEIHNRHLDDEQIQQDDNDGIIGLKRDQPQPLTDDDADIRAPPPPCRIRVGEHMDNIEISWLFESNPLSSMTLLYGHEKTPLLCARIEVNQHAVPLSI